MSLEQTLYPFEAGRRGKPDELDATIAHLLGAYILDLDRNARFDIRVHGTFRKGKPFVHVSGEVSQRILEHKYKKDMTKVICEHYNKIHRLLDGKVAIKFSFKPQSDELANNDEAGDSGNPIAVAYANTPNNLPWERFIAVGIRDIIDKIHQTHKVPAPYNKLVKHIAGLRADGKIGVNAIYEGAKLKRIDQITIATEHEPLLSIKALEDKLTKITQSYLATLQQAYHVNIGNPTIIVNGAKDWNTGGWRTDEGNREAKSYRDGFGSYGICEDSFSGEDPSKPSATGTFLARYIAVQIVGNKLADFAKVTLTYSIGTTDVGLNIVTNGTGKISQPKLEKWVRDNIPLHVSDTIQRFNLKSPELYRRIATNSDFFQNPSLPWNKFEVKYK